MKAHFLLWRESFLFPDILSSLEKKAQVVESHVCANDFNVFVTTNTPKSNYFEVIESLRAVFGVRKVISFPVLKEIVKGKMDKDIHIILAIRLSKKHNKKNLEDLIRQYSPIWADGVDGIYSYLVCFEPQNNDLKLFLKKIYEEQCEYLEPLVLLPQDK